MAQYLLIQLDPVRVVETYHVDDVIATRETSTPGEKLYQVVMNDQSVVYRTMDGQPYSPSGGFSVIDPAPATPAWAEEDLTSPPGVAPESRVISRLDYMNRFHDSELEALYTAAKSVIRVEVWLEKFKVADFIDLSDPRTISGVHALEAAGLIGAGRAVEILA